MGAAHIKAIADRFRDHPTESLLRIWEANDRNEWSEEAFQAIHAVLAERGIEPQPQPGPPPVAPHNKPSARYSREGLKIFGAIGLLGILGYVFSPSNPNRGNFLSLQQDLIIAGVSIGCGLLGGGIGYSIGKLVEKVSSARE